jgi:hypothetical protein
MFEHVLQLLLTMLLYGIHYIIILCRKNKVILYYSALKVSDFMVSFYIYGCYLFGYIREFLLT